MAIEKTISVIVNALNEEDTIAACLERVRALGPCELIVVDGGSTDNTRSVALGLGDIVVDSERGRAAQMNAGARASSGEILLFLHSDCILPEKAYELISSALMDTGVAAGAFGLAIDHPALWARLVGFAATMRSRVFGLPYGDQGLFMRRETFSQVGGFAPIPLMEDIEMGKRLRKAGRIVQLRQRMLSSPRRWLAHGVIRTTASNIVLGFAYAVVPPERFAGARQEATAPGADTAILIMAKYPEPGSVKTRLAGVLDDQERVDLYEQMLNQCVERLRRVPGAETSICYHPEGSEEYFRRFGLPLLLQEGPGLGESLLAGAKHALGSGAGKVLIVGTDVPGLGAGDALEAMEALEDSDVVFGPSEDGGYYLVGMKEPHSILFERIAWSTPQTLRQSIDRARDAGLRYALTRTLRDIDTPEDLEREGLL